MNVELKIYIALLRGINVSGQKIILMADLKKLFEKLQFTHVQTYIQSGNVVLQSTLDDEKEIEKKIIDAIYKTYKFDVKVLVVKLKEFISIVKNNPYKDKDLKEGERIYFTLLDAVPKKEEVTKLLQIKNDVDELQFKGKTVYVLCRKGYGNSVFSNNFVEKQLRVNATTRNFETMMKLIEIGKAL